MIDINLTILPIHSSKVHLEGEKVLTLLMFLGDKFRSLSKNEKGVTTVEYAVRKRLGRPTAAIDPAEVHRLREQGMSFRAIARQLGVSHPTVMASAARAT